LVHLSSRRPALLAFSPCIIVYSESGLHQDSHRLPHHWSPCFVSHATAWISIWTICIVGGTVRWILCICYQASLRQEGLRLVHARTRRHDGPHGLPAAHEHLHGLLLLLIHRRESCLGAQNAVSYIKNERRQPSAIMDSAGQGVREAVDLEDRGHKLIRDISPTLCYAWHEICSWCLVQHTGRASCGIVCCTAQLPVCTVRKLPCMLKWLSTLQKLHTYNGVGSVASSSFDYMMVLLSLIIHATTMECRQL